MSKRSNTTIDAMTALLVRARELAANISTGLEGAEAAAKDGEQNQAVGTLMGFEGDVAALSDILTTIKTLHRVSR